MASEESSSNGSVVVALVAASVTLTGSILGIVGVTGGTLGALLRNYPAAGLLLAAALVAILAGAAAAMPWPASKASSTPHRPLRLGARRRLAPAASPAPPQATSQRFDSTSRTPLWRSVLALGAVAVFTGSVVGIVATSTAAARTTQRPTVSTTLAPLDKPENWYQLEASVNASGLNNGERYLVVAHLLDDSGRVSREIFYTYAGPSANGDLAYDFTLTIPPRLNPTYAQIAVAAILQIEGQRVPLDSLCGTLGDAAPTNSSEVGSTVPADGNTCAVTRIPRLGDGSPTTGAQQSPAAGS